MTAHVQVLFLFNGHKLSNSRILAFLDSHYPYQHQKMSSQHRFSTSDVSRLVLHSTLLYLIDPVRGQPTVHGLDRHLNEDIWCHDNLQRKFLDSFALISSTGRKGGETASAICLEQDAFSGSVLRLSRNLGVPPDVYALLVDVLEDLSSIAHRGMCLW